MQLISRYRRTFGTCEAEDRQQSRDLWREKVYRGGGRKDARSRCEATKREEVGGGGEKHTHPEHTLPVSIHRNVNVLQQSQTGGGQRVAVQGERGGLQEESEGGDDK